MTLSLLSLNGGKTPGTYGEWTSLDTTTLMETSNTATMETNTPGTHLCGDTMMAGLCIGLELVMDGNSIGLPITTSLTTSGTSLTTPPITPPITLPTTHLPHGLESGGKTPGTPGEWTSPDTTTLMETSYTAITETNTSGIQLTGATIQDGP